VFVVTDVIADSALERAFIEVPLRRSLMSHTLRRMQTPDRAGRSHLIRSVDLPTFWTEARLPFEQANKRALHAVESSLPRRLFCISRHGWTDAKQCAIDVELTRPCH
jgi:hypothetical protein